ncbi:MAG TPA: hypothetical protein VF712_15540 [Thermoleophilaceae bacterium]
MFDPFATRLKHVVVLVQRECVVKGCRVTHFAVPTERDERLGRRGTRPVPASLQAAIPHGLETRVLHRVGFERWMDLYPPRQLRVMLASLRAVAEADVSDDIRTRLRLAISGAGEMAGFASRWDRFYPKAFEALANHRYGATGFSCEINLLADRGRGTLPRRLRASATAAEWLAQRLPPNGERSAGAPVRAVPSTARRRRPSPRTVYLATGSSERQLAADGSVDLVLTDPPYYDDVQYAELAALFLAWAKTANLVPPSVTLDLGSEAVLNRARGLDSERYRDLLTRIFTESKRTLRPSGRLVITFHNTDIRAWWALGRALSDADFGIDCLAVAEAENATDHPKRGRLGFTRDLVIECRARATERVDGPLIASGSAGAETQELLAAGRAIAAMDDDSLADFTARFKRLRGSVKPSRIN